MISNIIRFIFLFCLILSSGACVQKSIIKTQIGQSLSPPSASKLDFLVYIYADKSNTEVILSYNEAKGADLVRIEFNGLRLLKKEEHGNRIGFNYSIPSFQTNNSLVITTDDGNVRKEYALNIPINPLDFATVQISDFNSHQINGLKLSRIYDEKGVPWLEYANTTRQGVLFNETKDSIIILPRVNGLIGKGKTSISLYDYKEEKGISDDELVFVSYQTLYRSQIELDVVN